ncbi:hypothetical protein LTR85_012040 [Meristemomyces frigidus]|nr:hypothetical protein LTR85_012040 [Meristemomyces frigidus]
MSQTLTARTALRMLETPIAGAQAEPTHPEDRRRRSMQLSPTPLDKVHQRLPYLFTGTVPGSVPDGDEDDGSDNGDEDTAEESERQENFLGRMQSYSKLMHAHTLFQIGSPGTRTLPGYTRTMHAFTLNQLSDHRRVSRSEVSSPQLGIGGRHMLLPLKVCTELNKLSLDDPPAPSNTPKVGHGNIHEMDRRSMRRNLVTQPLPRDCVASVASRDFGINRSSVFWMELGQAI